MLSWFRRTKENPARELAMLGVEKRKTKALTERQRIFAMAIRMQRDLAKKGIAVPERSRMV